MSSDKPPVKPLFGKNSGPVAGFIAFALVAGGFTYHRRQQVEEARKPKVVARKVPGLASARKRDLEAIKKRAGEAVPKVEAFEYAADSPKELGKAILEATQQKTGRMKRLGQLFLTKPEYVHLVFPHLEVKKHGSAATFFYRNLFENARKTCRRELQLMETGPLTFVDVSYPKAKLRSQGSLKIYPEFVIHYRNKAGKAGKLLFAPQLVEYKGKFKVMVYRDTNKTRAFGSAARAGSNAPAAPSSSR